MADAVYRDYDSEALYAQYNNRAQVTEAELAAIKDDQTARSAAYRDSAPRKYLDLAYNPLGCAGVKSVCSYLSDRTFFNRESAK